MSNSLKAWATDTGRRALKTFGQTLVALLGANAVNVVDVPWGVYLGTAAMAAVVSVLQNVASLPDFSPEPEPATTGQDDPA